jgi:hypothetical protein
MVGDLIYDRLNGRAFEIAQVFHRRTIQDGLKASIGRQTFMLSHEGSPKDASMAGLGIMQTD